MLGPSLFGRISPAAMQFVFPESMLPILGVFAQLGIVFYMFLVGLELNAGLLRKQGRQEADYQLKIVVPNMDEYQRFLLDKITRIEGVIGVHSSFVLRKSVDSTALPLSYLRKKSQSPFTAQGNR